MEPTVDAVPVRIRGKRNARPEEKWNYGKRRDPKLQQRRRNTTTYGRHSALTTNLEETSPSSTLRLRKRRRRIASVSPLEALPPEVLQTIFAYSSNVMLPLTSAHLASKLCNSMHLRRQLSDSLLGPVLERGPAYTRAPDRDLASATRLLNSRFMDFGFFKSWLFSRSRVELAFTDSSSALSENMDWKALWSACHPSPGLLPPRKLLSTPFTDDKIEFLSVLAQHIKDITNLNAAYGELAVEGLTVAVQQGNIEMVSLLLRMGAPATTDLLRAAVIDAACDEHLVQLLLHPAQARDDTTRSNAIADDIDLLDSMVWSWAEQARKAKNPKGEWLMGLLRESQEQHVEADGLE